MNHLQLVVFLCDFVVTSRMLFQGKGKWKASASGSNANKEGRWRGMQEVLRSMVHGIAQSFGKSSFGGSKGDSWLN